MIDTSRSKIEILDSNEAFDDLGDINDPTVILKQRFKEYQKERNNR